MKLKKTSLFSQIHLKSIVQENNDNLQSNGPQSAVQVIPYQQGNLFNFEFKKKNDSFSPQKLSGLNTRINFKKKPITSLKNELYFYRPQPLLPPIILNQQIQQQVLSTDIQISQVERQRITKTNSFKDLAPIRISRNNTLQPTLQEMQEQLVVIRNKRAQKNNIQNSINDVIRFFQIEDEPPPQKQKHPGNALYKLENFTDWVNDLYGKDWFEDETKKISNESQNKKFRLRRSIM